MAWVAQNALECRRDRRLRSFERLREPFVVMNERAGDVVAPVVGDRFDQDVVNAVVSRSARSVDLIATVIGQTNYDHEVPLPPLGDISIDRGVLTLAESMIDSSA